MPAITYTPGEYVRKYITPQLKKEFIDNRMGFLATLGKAPAAAITSKGIIIEQLIRNTEAVVNRTTPFTDAEISRLLFANGFKTWDYVSTIPQEVDMDELRLAKDARNQTLRTEHTETRMRKVRNRIIRDISPEDISDTEIMVIDATGAPRANGLSTITEADLNALGEEIRGRSIDDDGRWNMTLNNYHVTDLRNENKDLQVFKENYYAASRSAQIKNLAGFKFGWDLNLPHFNAAGAVAPEGSVLDIDAGDQVASLFHYTPNTFYHAHSAMAHATNIDEDTRNNFPKQEYRETSYYVGGTIFKKYIGVIVSQKQ